MSIVHDELQDIKNHCETHVIGSKLITCVPSLVQVSISKTKYKQLTVCIQFPQEYPHNPLLVELKSKTLGEKLVSGLTKLCEEECKLYIGKPQASFHMYLQNLCAKKVLKVLKFLRRFLEENPLCVCSTEISSLKQMLGTHDELKLKQKSSAVLLAVFKDQYFLKLLASVPDQYPDEHVRIEMKDCNFPANFQKWFTGQSAEIARRCTEKPLKPKPKDQPFQPKPSLIPSLKFLIEEVKRYPLETCQLCKEKCFPDDPQKMISNGSDSKYIERVYCGHVFHNGCLDTYMKTPPFSGGKKCPQCKQVIYHDKWKATPKLAEERWAHKEAKKRELGEVVEFFE